MNEYKKHIVSGGVGLYILIGIMKELGRFLSRKWHLSWDIGTDKSSNFFGKLVGSRVLLFFF